MILLAPNIGYLVYQEQIIAFLNHSVVIQWVKQILSVEGFAKKTGTEQFIPNIKKWIYRYYGRKI